MSLSVNIPVYNEEKTISQVIKKVLKQPEVFEVVIVDDGSVDKTRDILKSIKNPKVKVFFQEKNQGKGAALIRGFKESKGDFVVVQDADLEYDPGQLGMLLKYAKPGVAVYGSRLMTSNPRAYFLSLMGNKLLTWFYNLLFSDNLTDSYTCYKLIPTKIVNSLDLESSGFEIEAEITAKLARRNIKIKEVPISYSPRKYAEGKKIKAPDAFKGLWTYFVVWLSFR